MTSASRGNIQARVSSRSWASVSHDHRHLGLNSIKLARSLFVSREDAAGATQMHAAFILQAPIGAIVLLGFPAIEQSIEVFFSLKKKQSLASWRRWLRRRWLRRRWRGVTARGHVTCTVSTWVCINDVVHVVWRRPIAAEKFATPITAVVGNLPHEENVGAGTIANVVRARDELSVGLEVVQVLLKLCLRIVIQAVWLIFFAVPAHISW